MKKNIFEALDLIDTQKEFAVFNQGCSHLDIELKASKIIETAKEFGLNKVVVIGGCTDSNQMVENSFRTIITEADLELVRIDSDGLGVYRIQKDLDPHFTLNIRTWEEALSLQTCFNHLVATARTAATVQDKIELEKKLLKEFPTVQSVQALELHLRSIPNVSFLGEIGRLFKLPDEITSAEKVVALFNAQERRGILVSESDRFEFNVAAKVGDLRATLKQGYEIGQQGSLRISSSRSGYFKLYSCVEFSLYTYKGDWVIEKHPELNLTNSPIEYISMWRRLKLEAQ